MGSEVNKRHVEAARKLFESRQSKNETPAGEIIKPHLRKFFDCKDIGPTPAINGAGFWKKPQHGISIKEGK